MKISPRVEYLSKLPEREGSIPRGSYGYIDPETTEIVHTVELVMLDVHMTWQCGCSYTLSLVNSSVFGGATSKPRLLMRAKRYGRVPAEWDSMGLTLGCA